MTDQLRRGLLSAGATLPLIGALRHRLGDRNHWRSPPVRLALFSSTLTQPELDTEQTGWDIYATLESRWVLIRRHSASPAR